MRKLILIFSVLIGNINFLQAQLSSAEVDRLSLELYQKQDWKELSKYAEKAIAEGIDYFYLRMRAGIARYELKDYRLSAPHFEHALKFNPTDELALEYLYYSFLFSERYEEAKKISRKFSANLRVKTGLDSLKNLNFFSIETGVKLASRPGFKPMFLFQLTAGHYVAKHISITHAFVHANQGDFRGKFAQNQYYVGAGIPLKNGFSLLPAVNLVLNRFETRDTASHIGPGPPFRPIVTHSFSPVLALGLKHNSRFLETSIGLSFSRFDSTWQGQLSAGLGVFPLGNNRFSFGVNAFAHEDFSNMDLNPAVSPWFRIIPTKRISLYGNVLINRTKNLVEQNGFIVNNSPDPTIFRAMLMASLRISKKTEIYSFFIRERKEVSSGNFYYFYNSPFIGIKFTP